MMSIMSAISRHADNVGRSFKQDANIEKLLENSTKL